MEKFKEFLYSCIFNYSSRQDEQAFGLVSNNIIPLLKIFSFFLFFVLVNYIIKIFLISNSIKIIDNYSKNIRENTFSTFIYTVKNHLFYGVIAGIIIQISIIFGSMLGVIALVFGAVIMIILLTVSLVFVFPIIVIEDSKPIEAYTGSMKMINNYFWQTMFYALVLVLCLGIPLAIIQATIGLPIYLSVIDMDSLNVYTSAVNPTVQEKLNMSMDLFKYLEKDHLVNSLIFSLIYSLSIPISSIVPTLLYYNVKAQKEVVMPS